MIKNLEELIRARTALNELILLLEDEHSKILNTKTLKTFETLLIRRIANIDVKRNTVCKNKFNKISYYNYSIKTEHDRTVMFKFKIERNAESLFTEDSLYKLNQELRDLYISIDNYILELKNTGGQTND